MREQRNRKADERIERLIAEMTVEEKIGQLNQVGPSPVGGLQLTLDELKKMKDDGRLSPEAYETAVRGTSMDEREDDVRAGRIGSFLGVYGADYCNRLQRIAVEESRLKIPLLFGFDVIHGQRTVFPIPLAESCAWDEALWKRSAEIAAKEAAADGIHWTFAPMLDIARDARWGRIAESAGEDPYLASRYAAAKVEGFQGDLDEEHVLACAKHFVAYGACVGGRDYNTVDMSLQTLHEIYLPPFAAAVKAGVKTVMSAFNDLNGVPCSTNRYLLTTVLREQLGFEGFVVSDASAIAECVNHGIAADGKEAAEKALSAGVEMDMMSFCFDRYLKESLNSGAISEEQLNEAVRRILRVKADKGLFERPYCKGQSIYAVPTAEHREAAKDAACRSAVLLKNDGILPIGTHEKVTLVGGLADRADELLGTWNIAGKGEDAVSIRAGLERAGIPFDYIPCCSADGTLNEAELRAACASENKTVIAVVGEPADNSGEASSFCKLTLPGQQEAMIDALAAAGKQVIALLCCGRPMEIPAVSERVSALLLLWHGGTEAGSAAADLLTGKYNPSGRLTVTFPHFTGECPLYYNHPNTGRPKAETRYSCKYLDAPIQPLYPFGYGLSYTEYRYDNLTLHPERGQLVASVTVKNAGTRAGEETVQLYVRDVAASRVRPVLELKGYEKVSLVPGEEKRVAIAVPYASLAFYDEAMQIDRAAGAFVVQVGHDASGGLTADFMLTEDLLNA